MQTKHHPLISELAQLTRFIPDNEVLEKTIFSANQYPFRSPLVTALAWSCFSPPLLTSMYCAETRVATPQLPLTDERKEWLNALDRDDHALRQYMQAHCHSKRLGLVFESLWHFFLQEDPTTELIAHNIPVRDGNKTLGEFDVLYYCHNSQQAIHLELAVKFFLGLNPSQQQPSLSHWFGPNRADRLDRKLARLSQHQLPLAHTAAGRDTLSKYGISAPAQQIQVSGTLFHRDDEKTAHQSLNPMHQRGHWQTLSEYIGLTASRSESTPWRYLAKPHWLEGQYASAADLNAEHLKLARERPIMAINAEQQRLFIVPDQWPEAI